MGSPQRAIIFLVYRAQGVPAAGARDEHAHQISQGSLDAPRSPGVASETEQIEEREVAIERVQRQLGWQDRMHAVIEGVRVLADKTVLVLVPERRSRRRREDRERDFGGRDE